MPPNSMPSVLISKIQIEDKIGNLKINKSPGPDLIHPRILHESRMVISDALKCLFDKSLNTGVLPDEWKTSLVSVIHKKGRKDQFQNYRPISLTCVVCKVLESIIRDQVMHYFMSNNLFTKNQFGFIKGRSVMLQLLNIVDDWVSIFDSGGQIDVIYTDFEKAFDKVPHRRPLHKLRVYGLNDKLISWIEDFLCYRTQRIKINGCLSSSRKV